MLTWHNRDRIIEWRSNVSPSVSQTPPKHTRSHDLKGPPKKHSKLLVSVVDNQEMGMKLSQLCSLVLGAASYAMHPNTYQCSKPWLIYSRLDQGFLSVLSPEERMKELPLLAHCKNILLHGHSSYFFYMPFYRAYHRHICDPEHQLNTIHDISIWFYSDRLPLFRHKIINYISQFDSANG